MADSSIDGCTEDGKNLGTEASGPQSCGLGARHQRLPGESRQMPTSQYLPPVCNGKLLATLAVMLPPPGRSSTRTCVPGASSLLKRTPQP